jgi:hypothetical protein
MNKLVAILCVISWAGFWSFGYLALTSEGHDSGQVIVAALLAFVGFLTGVFAYMRLSHAMPMDYRRVEQG